MSSPRKTALQRLRATAIAAVVLLGLPFLAPRAAEASCSVLEGDKDGNGTADLRIIGDAHKQIVRLELRNAGYLVEVDCNGNGSLNDSTDITKSGPAAVETYSLELAGGDAIAIEQTEDLAGARKDIVLSMGADAVTLTTHAHAILANSSLEIDAVGGAAAARVTLDFSGSTIDKSLVFVRTDLGPNNDAVTVYGPAKVSSSVVDMGIRLGSGNNKLTTTDGGALVTASTLTSHLTGSDVYAQYDTITSSFSGKIDKKSRLYYSANLGNGGGGPNYGGGIDRWTGQFDLRTFAIDPSTTLGGSEAYFSIKGGNGFDKIAVSDGGTQAPAVVNGILSFLLDGGAQPDDISLDWDGLTGYGKFRAWADGAMSYDQVVMGLVTGGTSHNDIDLYASGGPENDLGSPNGDSVAVEVLNYGAATFGPARAAILDGGLDEIDTCYFDGNAPHVGMNCEAGSW